MDDSEYLKIARLLKFGLDGTNAVKYTKSDERYDTITKLIAKGITPYEAKSISYLSQQELDTILELTSKDASLHDAIRYRTSSETKAHCEEFQNSGFDKQTAIILACSECKRFLDEKEIAHLGSIIKTMNSQTAKKDSLSIELFHLIRSITDKKEKDNTFFERLDNYVSSIDFKELRVHCRKLNNYSNKDLFSLIMWHFERQEPVNTKTIQFSQDELTALVENNYIKSKDLRDFVLSHPSMSKYIGQVPDSWLDKTEDKKQAQGLVFKAVSKFQNTNNVSALEKELSEILNKNVSVERQMPGSYGICYKISVDGAKYCIKVFRKKTISDVSLHGAKIEPQTGLFLNKHSNKFVKMYFGKICADEKQDAYIVTQFIDDNTTPEISDDIDTSYRIECLDDNKRNTINGINVDFGGVKIVKIN